MHREALIQAAAHTCVRELCGALAAACIHSCAQADGFCDAPQMFLIIFIHFSLGAAIGQGPGNTFMFLVVFNCFSLGAAAG